MTADKFTKHDGGKPRVELVPPEAILAIARAYTMGAPKYGRDNWKQCEDWSRIYGALQRHLLAWSSGELADKESGLSHLDHAICNLAMLCWADSRKVATK